MTTIDELEAMDFVNWDAAAAGPNNLDMPMETEGAVDSTTTATATAPIPAPAGEFGELAEPNMDLVFGNVEQDDWSFWALEHFESTQVPGGPGFDTAAFEEADMQQAADSEMTWEFPEKPCSRCASGNYSCKRIREGKYKGYCTTCVALRCECSFGPGVTNLTSGAGENFPANPWPTMGDRPETSILLEDDLAGIVKPMPCLATVRDETTQAKEQPAAPAASNPQPKAGARFSRESVKVLKNWVSTHSKHPYPTEDEKENLQKITGLSKTQIANWLANARRRGKIHVTRATSPHIGQGYAQAMDIPQRRGTPSPFEAMNPLQRWANSPPENEPASVTAIARAVSASNSWSQSSSGRNSPYVSNYSDDGSGRSSWGCNQSSVSSLGTSHSSGGSFASAYSHKSRGSLGSIPSFVRSNRGRRRRRRAPTKPAEANKASQPVKTYQCTFCTETFGTKHDWQRHEKSLHLSLERWVCSPDGPTMVNPETGVISCVFCGEANPDEEHIESHNFVACTERTQEERTFYRKDHLRQHLKLVHNVKYLAWSMDKWRAASPEIRSRCGFCGTVLDSWKHRVDHLAEHFKTGNTMADWKGDWGFEEPVLEMVENSIPPYMIDDERKSPLPFEASTNAPSTPANVFELLKVELQCYLTRTTEEQHGVPPTDEELQHEACRVLFTAEASSKHFSSNNFNSHSSSWLRDLILSSDPITTRAKFQPIRSQCENQIANLRINGKSDIWGDCDLESQLQEFVHARRLLGLTAMDHELQVESCRIISRIEEKSSHPCEAIANWLLRLIHSAPTWLVDFRRRAYLPCNDEVIDINQRSKDPTTIDSTIHNYSRLDRELGEYLQLQRSVLAVGGGGGNGGVVEPTDADLQRQARIIIYDHDDEWNQTAADDKEWLDSFRARHPPLSSNSSPGSGSGNIACPDLAAVTAPGHILSFGGGNNKSGGSPLAHGPNYLSDGVNCYRRLAQGLSRFVASTMSPNNPNCHVPTDEELQHQARWIVYDDDDPWNQTAADNAEWLSRFKQDCGIIPIETPEYSEPTTATTATTATTTTSWVSPPAAAEAPQQQPFILAPNLTSTATLTCPQSQPELPTFFPPGQPTQQSFPPDLEKSLLEFIKRELSCTSSMSPPTFPSDDKLRQRARDILSMQRTPCDDPTLLGRFKMVAVGKLMSGGGSSGLDMARATPMSAPIVATAAGGTGIAMPTPRAGTGMAGMGMRSGITDGLAALGGGNGNQKAGMSVRPGIGAGGGLWNTTVDERDEDEVVPQLVSTGQGQAGFRLTEEELEDMLKDVGRAGDGLDLDFAF